jgi:hypothetical protein
MNTEIQPEITPNQKPYQCRHLFADGHRCGSRAMRKEAFCYYHHTTRKPAPRALHGNVPHETPAQATFDLPFPEDRTSIQLAIGEIIRRLATNSLDTKRAGLLLYALQIASLNLPKATPNDDRYEEEDVESDIEDHPTLGPIAPIAEYTPYDPPVPGSHLLRALREEAARKDREDDAFDEEEDEEPSLTQQNHPKTPTRILPSIQATASPRTPVILGGWLCPVVPLTVLRGSSHASDLLCPDALWRKDRPRRHAH